MPFDGFFTNSIVKELSLLSDGRIDKIHQPTKDEIILYIRKDKKAYKVLFSCNPSFPRVHITETDKENPLVPPGFCMVLRKYIAGAKLKGVNQINFDRIVDFEIEGRDELGYPLTFHLIIEIMGKHSNIILINDKEKIVDSVKHITSETSRYRTVLPSFDYISPPLSGKVSPLNITKDEFDKYLNSKDLETASKAIMSSFLGISKKFSDDVTENYKNTKLIELLADERDTISSNFFYYMAKVKSCSFNYRIYYNNDLMNDFYCLPLKSYNGLTSIDFDSPSKLLDSFYGQRDLKNSLKQKYSDLFKLISNLYDRTLKKIQIHKEKLIECSNYETYKVYGDILMANQFSLEDGMKSVTLQNFYDENLNDITIPLDDDISINQNAQKYYKKYNKEKITIETVTLQLKEAEDEKLYLENILYNVENANDIETLEEIKSELSSIGYIKKRGKQSKGSKKSLPHHFVSSDGYDIYVGKNNNQNDYLTTKFAVSSDIWLHTKEIPGSHVIIKSKSGEVSDTAILEAANLAAYHSKGQNSTNVPVDYTEKKNVKKPSGAKPGMVIYTTNKTIYITPDETKVKSLTKLSK
ncbi:Rqc2 family fibronectin-binding protein [Clostridium cylindrosporum]|uniref:Rqc2 homolog RqcH n=1 Tax=Clostridium cylindrosporum DSM 605 TaxID=1121307 RepID=A0A0J8D6G1_CLOCY|nr:NFACT RNA binding domain-containing protein [Clostridium cylindrosporum]KMT21442.1 putative RNA-binding protein, snRNP like protein [Clostridium cylindrosporum DSM 605]